VWGRLAMIPGAAAELRVKNNTLLHHYPVTPDERLSVRRHSFSVLTQIEVARRALSNFVNARAANCLLRCTQASASFH
jgi:hypothetical protein